MKTLKDLKKDINKDKNLKERYDILLRGQDDLGNKVEFYVSRGREAYIDFQYDNYDRNIADNAKTIILCLDNDSAGEKGCQKLYKFLRSDFNFKRVVFPSGKKDVQDCSRDEILSMFENLEDYPKRVFKKYE